jgi:hypothetical protein
MILRAHDCVIRAPANWNSSGFELDRALLMLLAVALTARTFYSPFNCAQFIVSEPIEKIFCLIIGPVDNVCRLGLPGVRGCHQKFAVLRFVLLRELT